MRLKDFCAKLLTIDPETQITPGTITAGDLLLKLSKFPGDAVVTSNGFRPFIEVQELTPEGDRLSRTTRLPI